MDGGWGGCWGGGIGANGAVAPGGIFWRDFQIPHEVRIAIWSFQILREKERREKERREKKKINMKITKEKERWGE